jgi:UDP-N-acetylmuramate dehydrogenase
VRFDEPLARYTTYRIGGPAAALVVPRAEQDVAAVLAAVREAGVPWMAMGLGSNLLISDAGFPGVVLRFGKELSSLDGGTGDQQVWTAQAGLPTPLLARRSASAGLGGVHRLVGVPGTVGGGGGVAMNAGAHGQEFQDVVERIRVVTPEGAVQDLSGSAVPWRYRGWGLDGYVVLSATIRLTPADPAQLAREVRQHFEWRKAGTRSMSHVVDRFSGIPIPRSARRPGSSSTRPDSRDCRLAAPWFPPNTPTTSSTRVRRQPRTCAA